MSELAIQGADQLAELGKALKEAGDKTLRRETLRVLRDKAKPMGEAAKVNALAVLPAGGGLAAYVAKSRISTRTRLSGNQVGIRIVGARSKDGGAVDLDAMDRGRLRHKTFGHRPWVTQSIPAGWWTDPLTKESANAIEAVGDAVAVALAKAVAAAAAK